MAQLALACSARALAGRHRWSQAASGGFGGCTHRRARPARASAPPSAEAATGAEDDALPSLQHRILAARRKEDEVADGLASARRERIRLEEQLAAQEAADAALAAAAITRAEMPSDARRAATSGKSRFADPPPTPKPAPPPRKLSPAMRKLKMRRKGSFRAKMNAVQEIAEVKQRLSRAPSEEQQDALASDSISTETPAEESCILPKPIFVLSDCTGETAVNTVRAALGQFEQCLDESFPTNLHVFRFISDKEQVSRILRCAADDDALVVYTLVDSEIIDEVKHRGGELGLRTVDLWGGLLSSLEGHLEQVRMGIPLTKRNSDAAGGNKGGASAGGVRNILQQRRRKPLSDAYFKRMRAIEFTRQLDDGACPERWKDADIVIIGVSRSGKTPLCIFMAQRGFKVANYPLVPGVDPPKELFEVDPWRVFGLLVDPLVLSSVRKSRVAALGTNDGMGTYSGLAAVRTEIVHAKKLYEENGFTLLDVTNTGVEETAAKILEILERQAGFTHPLISSVRDINAI